MGAVVVLEGEVAGPLRGVADKDEASNERGHGQEAEDDGEQGLLAGTASLGDGF